MQQEIHTVNGLHHEEIEAVGSLRKSPQTVDYGHMIKTLAVWRNILNARLMAVIVLLGALGGFGFAVYDPEPLRLWALAIYSVLCVWPVLALGLKKN